MELKKIDINGLNDIYAVDVFEKEFKKAVDESWKSDPPWKRYQTKLIKNLVVLDTEKEQAVRPCSRWRQLSAAPGRDTGHRGGIRLRKIHHRKPHHPPAERDGRPHCVRWA